MNESHHGLWLHVTLLAIGDADRLLDLIQRNCLTADAIVAATRAEGVGYFHQHFIQQVYLLRCDTVLEEQCFIKSQAAFLCGPTDRTW
ncbi:hypothetical protein D3C75_1074100 [compost metagenome]